nr:hypothetical protein [Tanacetum cinerariifolium]
MSSSPHSTIIPSDSDIENTFSSTNILNYFPASPGSISPHSSNNFTKYLLDILVFLPLHDDSKMEVIHHSTTPKFIPSKKISPKDTKTPVESPILVSSSSSEGSSSPVRSTSLDYLFDESNFVELDNSVNETYKNVSQDIRDQLNAKAEAVQIILTGIDNDIYSTVDACSNACEMWKAIETMVNHWNRITQEWQRFVTLVKQSQELKTISYHKLYDILKQHQHEVNEIRAEKIACIANPLALVAQQHPIYHPQTHPTHYTPNSSTRSQQAATRNRGKATVNTPQPVYDQEPSMVDEDDETLKDKEIDKIMALISLSFKKIYKPTNNNLRTSSNTSRANQDNSPRINRNAGYENQRIGNVAGARENVASSMGYHFHHNNDHMETKKKIDEE